MISTEFQKRALAYRREKRDMEKAGYERVGEGGGNLWELYRGGRYNHRIIDAKISVDGKEVFKGNTTKNLGYFTASFKTTTGKKIKVELIGQAAITEDNSKEVNGKKLDDGVARNDANAKGTFAIIEVEIYGPVKK